MEAKFIASIIIALIVGVAIGYGISLVPGAAPAPGAKVLTGKIPIGALLTLTGELSSYGENSKAALELAVTEINDWLEKKGAQWKVDLIIEDTATDPKTAFDKIQILAGKGVKVVIGPMTSAEVSEVKSFADGNQILVVSQSSTSPALSIPGDWIYRYCPDDTIQGPAAARVLYDLGARWVVPIWRGDTWGDGVEKETKIAFEKILKETGEEGGFLEDKGIRYTPGTKEFTTEAATLNTVISDLVSKYGADKVGIYYVGFEEAVAFVLAAKQYDVLWKVVWVGTDGTAGLTPLVETKEAAEFSWKVKWLHPVFAPTVNPRYDKVKKYVLDKLGREPDPYAYAAYDALWTVALAIDMLGEYDPAKIRDILPSILEWYMGASGHFELNKNGDRAFSDYDLMIIREVSPGQYKWDLGGVWRASTDTIEWSDWLAPLLGK